MGGAGQYGGGTSAAGMMPVCGPGAHGAATRWRGAAEALALLVAAVTTAAATASGDDACPTRVLLDRQLRARLVPICAVDDQSVTYEEGPGLLRVEARDQFVAYLPPAADPASDVPYALTPRSWREVLVQVAQGLARAGDARFVELVDGQRYVGRPAPRLDAADASTMGWEHPVFGSLELPLERVSRVVVLPLHVDRTMAPLEGLDDRVVLANGDIIEGFVVSIAEPLLIESAGQQRAIPLGLVAGVALANPAEPRAGPTAWLADGSVVQFGAISTSRRGEVTLTLAQPDQSAGEGDRSTAETVAGVYPLDDVLAMVLVPQRLMPLARVPMSRYEASSSRRWTEAPQIGEARDALLDAPPITLPGPIRVEWTIPASARRVAGLAELPRAMWTWGDCELVISERSHEADWHELFRGRLHAGAPLAEFNAQIAPAAAPRSLRFELLEGRHGPVQDRIVLWRTVLLLDDAPPG